MGNFERVGETGALMIVGEHEDLRLTGKSAKGGRMQNAIAVAFETRAIHVGVLFDGAVTAAMRASGQACHRPILGVFTATPINEIVTAGAGP